jgi:hypothetical protein
MKTWDVNWISILDLPYFLEHYNVNANAGIGEFEDEILKLVKFAH